jgi:hypothetical protein
MAAPQAVKDLVERFERNRESYQSTGYNETQLRREFLDPLFVALGWDVDNRQGRAEAYKDVIHEDAIKVGGATNFLRETGTPLRGGYFRMKTAYLNPFPLPVDKMSHGTESVLHDALVDLCDNAVTLRGRLAAGKVPNDKTVIQRQIDATDRQIDQLVYELTDAEIRLVEEATA